MKSINISVIGAYGEENFGDDLLMTVCEDILQEANLEGCKLNFVGCKSNYPIKFLSKSMYMQSDFEADLIVYGGGTQFFSFSNENKTFYGKIFYLLKNPSSIVDILKNKIIKIKENKFKPYVFFLGIGIGPFNENNQMIKKTQGFLENSDFVSVRDDVSFKYCEDWGVEVVLGADLVFSSWFEKRLKSSKEKKRCNVEIIKKKRIGVIIRDWVFGDTFYLNNLMEYVRKNETYDFTYIILSKMKDENCIRLIENCEESKCLIWDPSSMSFNCFIDQLSEFDAFISARYHGAIIGALLGKSVVAIEIEPKLKILSEQIPEMFLWEKTFRIEDLDRIVERALRTTPDYNSSLFSAKIKADSMILEFIDKVNVIKN